jgi:hypothetical protein
LPLKTQAGKKTEGAETFALSFVLNREARE